MKRIGAVCEELFLASTARVDERKKSIGSEESSQTNVATGTNSGADSRLSTASGTLPGTGTSGNVSVRTGSLSRPSGQSGGGSSSRTGPPTQGRDGGNVSLRTGSLPRPSGQSGGGSSSRIGPPTRSTSVKSNSSRRVPDRSESLASNGTEPRKSAASYPRSRAPRRTPGQSSAGPAQRPVGGKYRAQSLNINPSLCNTDADCDEMSPREVQGLHRKSVPTKTNNVGFDVNKDSDTKEFAKPISVENLTSQHTGNRSSAPTLKSRERISRDSSREKRNRASSQRTREGLSGRGPPLFSSHANLSPRLPQTSALEALPRRRAKSERVEPFHSGSSNGSRTVSQPRHLGRAASLRCDGVSILPNIFSRGRLLSWPLGVAPQVVYAAETSHELDDGHGAAGLSATLLCKMGAKHRAWDVVRVGDGFCVRIVGWHGAELRNVRGGEGGRTVVYSNLHKDEGGQVCSVKGSPAQVHDERSSSDFSGYHFVSERLGAAASCAFSGMEQVGLTVGLWTGGGTSQGPSTDLEGEVRWRLLREDECETIGRNGATLMRFGYYFFLDVPCATRLFTNTDTPEHVRLVARRAGDGAIDEEASKQLTYIVVRVTAD